MPPRPAYLALGALALAAALPREARADEPVPVEVRVPEAFSLRGAGELTGTRASCSPPCTLRLTPGIYTYASSRRTGDTVAFTGPSRLDLHGPAEPLHTAGLVMAGVGLLGVAGPVIAIFSTCTDSTVDAFGRVTPRSCVRFGESTDKALAIVAGSGFFVGVVGAILFFATSGGLTVTDVPHASEKGLRAGLLRGGTFVF